MGWRYNGGGWINGVPLRDMLHEESLPHLPLISKSQFYEYVDDDKLEVIGRLAAPTIKKVLLVCPTYRFERPTIESMYAFDWDCLDWFVTKDNPGKGYKNIEHNMNKARKVFLGGDYDAMFIFESDMEAAPDTIRRLATVDAPVRGVLYVMRQWSHASNLLGWDRRDPDNRSNIPTRMVERDRLIRTNGVSHGVTLIDREVIERIEFRCEGILPPDAAFMSDCNRLGIAQVADTGIVCGHVTEDGRTLYPGD